MKAEKPDTSLTWINGQAQHTIDINDRGFLYGDGVWETIAVSHYQPQLLEKHLARLEKGLNCLALPYSDHQPNRLQTLNNKLNDIASEHETAVLKVIITRGCGQRGYNPATAQTCTEVIQLSPRSPPPPLHQHAGITLGLCQNIYLSKQPKLAGIKHSNRLEQILIRAAFQKNWQEALVCDEQGYVIEGSMTNTFIVTAENQVLTPDLQACGVAGVMREYIMEQLAIMGIDCRVTSFKIDQVHTAKSIFLTNSLIGIWPVAHFAERSFSNPDWLNALQKTIQQVV